MREHLLLMEAIWSDPTAQPLTQKLVLWEHLRPNTGINYEARNEKREARNQPVFDSRLLHNQRTILDNGNPLSALQSDPDIAVHLSLRVRNLGPAERYLSTFILSQMLCCWMWVES